MTAHGVKQDVAALVYTHVDNLREVVADTPEEARHRAQDALVLAVSVGTKVRCVLLSMSTIRAGAVEPGTGS